MIQNTKELLELANKVSSTAFCHGFAYSEANCAELPVKMEKVNANKALEDLMVAIGKQVERIYQLTKERDAAFTMSRCECESSEACANLVAKDKEIKRLTKERNVAAAVERERCKQAIRNTRDKSGANADGQRWLQRATRDDFIASIDAQQSIIDERDAEIKRLTKDAEQLRTLLKEATCEARHPDYDWPVCLSKEINAAIAAGSQPELKGV